MKATMKLPEGYNEFFKVDLLKNKKQMWFVNLLALALTAVLLVIGGFMQPISTMAMDENNVAPFFAKWLGILAAMAVYLVLHELVHGICMKHYSGVKAHYGFTGLYAYAGSEAYFAKVPYIVIALAPVVVWGVVLFVACCLVPANWFWPVYFIQICNISGAAGDAYVTAKFSKFPDDILVHDNGVSMVVYSKS